MDRMNGQFAAMEYLLKKQDEIYKIRIPVLFPIMVVVFFLVSVVLFGMLVGR